MKGQRQARMPVVTSVITRDPVLPRLGAVQLTGCNSNMESNTGRYLGCPWVMPPCIHRVH